MARHWGSNLEPSNSAVTDTLTHTPCESTQGKLNFRSAASTTTARRRLAHMRRRECCHVATAARSNVEWELRAKTSCEWFRITLREGTGLTDISYALY